MNAAAPRPNQSGASRGCRSDSFWNASSASPNRRSASAAEASSAIAASDFARCANAAAGRSTALTITQTPSRDISQLSDRRTDADIVLHLSKLAVVHHAVVRGEEVHELLVVLR